MYLFLSSSERALEIFTILGSSCVPILQLITFSLEDYIVGFDNISSFKNNLSRGTRPLGMKFPLNSMISWLAIEFSENDLVWFVSIASSSLITEVENSPVNSRN